MPELVGALLGAAAPHLERCPGSVECLLGALVGRQHRDAAQSLERDLRTCGRAPTRQAQPWLALGNAAPALALGGLRGIGHDSGERAGHSGILTMAEARQHLDDGVVVAPVRVDVGPRPGGSRHAVAAASILRRQQAVENGVELVEVAARHAHIGEEVEAVGQEARAVVVGGRGGGPRRELLDELSNVLGAEHRIMRRRDARVGPRQVQHTDERRPHREWLGRVEQPSHRVGAQAPRLDQGAHRIGRSNGVHAHMIRIGCAPAPRIAPSIARGYTPACAQVSSRPSAASAGATLAESCPSG